MTYAEYIKERQRRGYTDADAIDSKAESTDELVSIIFADGYKFDSEIENAVIIRAGMDMEYDEWEEIGENILFCALEELGYNDKGEQKMKQYRIKAEFLSAWGNEVDENTIVDENEVKRLSREWGIPADDLMKQLDEVGELTDYENQQDIWDD